MVRKPRGKQKTPKPYISKEAHETAEETTSTQELGALKIQDEVNESDTNEKMNERKDGRAEELHSHSEFPGTLPVKH